MKKFCFLFCSVLMAASTTAFAQTTFGIRGGLNIANSDITAVTTESVQSEDSYTGFFFGPSMEFQIPIIGIGVDGAILYSQSGMQLSNDEEMKLQSIAIPISLKGRFGLGNMLAVLVHLGPQFDFNIGDAEKFINDSNGDLSRFTTEKVVASLNIGAGVRLFNKFDVEANYNLPFKDKSTYEQFADGITKDNYKAANALVNEAISQKILQISLTYRF